MTRKTLTLIALILAAILATATTLAIRARRDQPREGAAPARTR